ncbi:YIP1 family protein [Paenibacillus sp. SC116]|uniref:Yip1 family protein n=1 Tax=Paenibacillus sp. SC116 TaxID=2968986 RepID=UPI00215AD791|nr:Yip1 family protein [Paenibacillus sp. SC116]MCR8845180.1 YIP1 family protein [Paenibacillus sp. SC116]
MSANTDAMVWKQRLRELGEMWLRPREVMREHMRVTKSDGFSLLLVVISSFFGTLDGYAKDGMGDHSSLGTIILLAFVVGIISGIISFYISSFLMLWIGTMLGGTADSQEIRAVNGLAGYGPQAIVGLLWIPSLFIFGKQVFTTTATGFLVAGWAALIAIVGFVIVIWSFVILVVGISEAHQFSKKRALATILLPVILIFFIAILPATMLG